MVADGYKDTEIGVIPVEWEAVGITDIAKTFIGLVTTMTKHYEETGVPLIRNSDIKQNKITKEKLIYLNPIFAKQNENKKLKYNDVVTVHTGDIGVSAVIDSGLDGCLGFATLNTRIIDENVSSKYLCWYFNSQKNINFALSMATGDGRNNFNLKDFNQTRIPLPPLKEQKKIADILSTADDKIDAIDIQIDRAETLKKGLLQKLLSEGIRHSEFKDSELGMIPESWEVVEFGKHLDVKSGFGFKASDYSQNGIPLVKIDNVSYGKIIWENITYLPTVFIEKYKELILSKDDILLALNRPITQNKLKMAMLKEKDAPSILYQRVGKILFDETYFYKFVYYMLYRYVYDFVVHHSVGTDQPFINITKIRKLLIPLPPLEEQKQIADILSSADEKLEVLKNKKEKYETLKKGLLQKLLSGEVRVNV